MLNVEKLEARDTPASGIDVAQVGTSLLITMNDPGYVSVQPTQVVTSYGNFPTTGTITDVTVNGSNKDDVIEVNTAANTQLYGNGGDDTIFGGTGTNFIDAGKGKDVVYSLLGTNTINSSDHSMDRVFTNFNATVTSDSKDIVVRFFGPGRTPGAGFVGMSTTGDDAGVLYIAPTNTGTSTVITQDGPNTVVTYNFGNGVQTQSFQNVKTIAYFGGSGNDFYMNTTNIPEAAYGSAGNDIVISGVGKFSLLKGSSGSDMLFGRAEHNDISTNQSNGSVDTVFLLDGFKNNIVRASSVDVVVGLTPSDTFILEPNS